MRLMSYDGAVIPPHKKIKQIALEEHSIRRARALYSTDYYGSDHDTAEQD